MSTFRIYHRVKLQQRQRLKKTTARQGKQSRWLWAILAGLALLFTIPMLVLGYRLSDTLANSPDLSAIPALFDAQSGAFYHPTELFDRSGATVIYQYTPTGAARAYRTVEVGTADSVSPYLMQSVIALNEPQFWQGTRIPLKEMFSDQPLTLAERLVARFVLSAETEGMQRAIQLRILGLQLNSTYGKSQVLEWYLNSAYFGQKAFGVESAAQLYFGKSATQLNYAESIMLAAVEQAPALNPIDSPSASEVLYQQALVIMVEHGALNTEEYAAVHQPPAVVSHAQDTSQPYRAFTAHAMQQVLDRFGQWQGAFGGLKIQTTLDLDLQKQITCVTELQLKRMQAGADIEINANLEACPAAYYLPAIPAFQSAFDNPLSASVLVQDVQTGEVLAYLGDLHDGVESAAETRHQAASLLTPMLATAAFSRGFSPSSMVWDISPAPDSPWASYAGDVQTYHGPQRLRYAIANDYIFPLMDLYDSVGSETVWNTAATLGLDNSLVRSSQADIFLGGSSASIVEVSRAYQSIANLGTQNGLPQKDADGLDAAFILAVEKSDGTTLPSELQSRSVLSPGLAYVMHNVLADENARWPSLDYPNLTEISRPAGVKIGRTAAQDESWILGYTRQRLITVWLGQDAAETVEPISWQLSADIWHALIKYASKSMNAAQWQSPLDVTSLEVCDPSGKLPTLDCPNKVTEVFISGNEPITYDDLYRSVQINRETGLLATVYTPLELVEEKTFMIIPDFANAWAEEEQIPQPPEMYDTLSSDPGTDTVRITNPQAYDVVSHNVEIYGTASGENFQFYRLQVGEGLNPLSWLQISEEQTTPVEGGLLGTWSTDSDGLYAIRLSVVREDQSLETHIVQVTVDNTDPQVQILFPADGESITGDGTTYSYFQVEAGDNVGIAKVAWILDGQWIADGTQAPYGVLWLPEKGKHTLVAKATDLAGNLTISEVVNFEVK